MQDISSVWRPLAFLPVTLSDELHFCFNLGNFTSRTQVTQCKESTCSVEDKDLIPGSGRYPGEGNSNPLQYSCLVNAMDREAWQATIYGVIKQSDTTERLNNSVSFSVMSSRFVFVTTCVMVSLLFKTE